MIKIIWKRNKVKCNCCKSILKYDPEDLQEEKSALSNDVIFYYIQCPVCKGTVRVSN